MQFPYLAIIMVGSLLASSFNDGLKHSDTIKAVGSTNTAKSHGYHQPKDCWKPHGPKKSLSRYGSYDKLLADLDSMRLPSSGSDESKPRGLVFFVVVPDGEKKISKKKGKKPKASGRKNPAPDF